MTVSPGDRPTMDDLHELWLRHGRALVLYARQWCRSPEDVVQEAFIALSRTREYPRNPSAWLFTTVRHQAINWHRGERRRRKNHQKASELRPCWFEEDNDGTIDTTELHKALESLPPPQREIVIARIWGKQTYEDIAHMMGSSRSSVHREYERALKQLARFLQSDLTGDPRHESAITSRPSSTP